jgi:transcriptional regulator of arginine metabolism
MPTTNPTHATGNGRKKRHQEILDLIGTHYVRSQGELQELLDERGFDVNQGTLSRDLRELGVIKSPDGYELPLNGHPARDDQVGALNGAIKQWLKEAVVAQNQVLLKTPPGGAQPLAFSLDQVGLAPALGTVAGDDTILVICATNKDARRFAREVESMR